MAKGNKYVLEKNQKYYANCKNSSEICPLVDDLEGAEIRKIPLFIQFAFALISWVVIANNKSEGAEWYNSLFFFSTPMFLEYISYRSKEKISDLIFLTQKIIFGFTATIGAVGVFTDALSINIENNTSYIKISETFFIMKGKEINIIWVVFLLLISVGLILTQTLNLSSKREEMLAISNESA